MSYESYDCLTVEVNRGVAFVSIDHPPINLIDLPLMMELNQLGKDLEADNQVRVIVFQSANPDFFMAHADVSIFQGMVENPRPESDKLSLFNVMVERYRTMDKVTIGKVEGRARGGGSEILLSLDMRFAAIGRAVFSQPEVAIGLNPGGGGTQRLPGLVGRGRAMEILLGAQDFTAELAERYGYINRALPADELGAFVDSLAYRIASFSPETVALAKASIEAAGLPTVVEGLLAETRNFHKSITLESTQKRMTNFLKNGGQTHEGESGDFQSLVAAVPEDDEV